MTDYLPLVRQTADLRMEEIMRKETTWEEVFRESIVLLLRSLADAMERTPEHLPPAPNFRIVFEFEQQHWSGRLVAKIETDESVDHLPETHEMSPAGFIREIAEEKSDDS